MLCLGFNGGLSLVHEDLYEEAFGHDASAVAIRDGHIIAGIEEERLDRIKHSDKFPVNAMRFCLDQVKARPQDVDCFAFYATEEFCDAIMSDLLPELVGQFSARSLAHSRLQHALDCEISPEKIRFVPHHMSHAASAFFLSGMSQSLIFAMDGYGDFLSGLVGVGDNGAIEELASFPQNKSLGLMYLDVIQFLGYGLFDEYKVMGLAPYGDPAIYREALRAAYQLFPDGGYELDRGQIVPALKPLIVPRKKGEPFTQQHKNLAAALQEALEAIVMHQLSYWANATNQKNLCLAGGVAHNCTLNGKVLYSGMFNRVFVQPAAHDAGCALGAALIASQEAGYPAPAGRMRHVYWGTDLGDDIQAQLERWSNFLSFEESQDAARTTAELIASGNVVGWIQGRSEFGPRALGNRSILADPRPAGNKERINQMVKKREGYRPFAPSVLEEEAREFFVLPENEGSFPFMIFVVDVRAGKRDLLGAITHVDGSARLQTVDRDTNPRYWELIKQFQDITGVPVLLNTSFNNNVEPIVDSVEDAIVSYLTTGLDYLVVGDFIAKKHQYQLNPEIWATLSASLPPYVKLQNTSANASQTITNSEIHTTYDRRFKLPVSPLMARFLVELGGGGSVGDIMQGLDIKNAEEQQLLIEEMNDLWTRRLLRLHPVVSAKQAGSREVNRHSAVSGVHSS